MRIVTHDDAIIIISDNSVDTAYLHHIFDRGTRIIMHDIPSLDNDSEINITIRKNYGI